MLASESHAAEPKQTTIIDPINPLKARPPHVTPKAKSVIFLFMTGGPSHVDTFDYKPVLNKLHMKKIPDSIIKNKKDAVENAVF